MNSFDRQQELALQRIPNSIEIPIEMVRSKRTQGAAFTLACEASGLESKEIFLPLEIDEATFSRMKSGKNTLPGDKTEQFCAVVGNRIYVEWLASRVGCGLYVLKTEAERRAEEAEHRADEAEKKLAWAMQVIKEMKP